MNEPLVSIVIAVKNAERYLAEALDSVMAQTYPAYEVLIVDGQSTDNTARIAQAYAPVRLLSQTGEGFAGAWNEGIDAARGEFIALLDSDDLWAPQKLRLQVDYLAQHPEMACVVGHMRFFLAAGSVAPPEFKQELFERDHVGYMPGALLARKPVFDSVGKFDTRWVIASDIDWFAQAKDKDLPIGIVPEVLLYKRIHQSNLSNLTARLPVYNREMIRVAKDSIERQRARRLAAEPRAAARELPRRGS